MGHYDDWAAAYPEADAERVRAVDDAAQTTHTLNDLHPRQAAAHAAFGGCPVELTERPQWVLWRYDGKGTKRPVQRDGSGASTTDPSTWTTFRTTLATFRSGGRRFAGVGYVFTADDPYTGIDLDDVVVDGRIVIPEAQAIVDAMHSYAEISPSGTGVKLWVRGSIPHSLKQKMAGGWQIEMYDQRRYFTVTGEHVPGTPTDVLPAHEPLARLYQSLRPERSSLPATPHIQMELDDDRARRYALAALDGERQKMLAAQPGMRHNIRYGSAYRLGSFVPILSEQEIFDALAVNFDPDRHSAERAIRDGIARGQQNPATIPAPRAFAEKPLRYVDRTTADDELITDEAADQCIDPRDAEIARLRRELATSKQRRNELETWRQWQVTLLRKPSEQFSANDKLTAIALRPEMEYRKHAGISEAQPIFIEVACANTGASPGTYGASLRNLANAGAIERRETRDATTGHTRILIRPLAFDTPETWRPPETRNHGGKRSRKPAEPTLVCTTCGPDAPSYRQVTTITAYICGACGDVVDEHEHVSEARPHPSSGILSSNERPMPTSPPMSAAVPPPPEPGAEPVHAAAPTTPAQCAPSTATAQVAAPLTDAMVPLSVKLRFRQRGARRRPP